MKFLIWNVIIEINFFKNITFWSFDMPVFDFSLWKKSNLTNSRVYIGYQKRSRDLQKGINRSKFLGVVGGKAANHFLFHCVYLWKGQLKIRNRKWKTTKKHKKQKKNSTTFLVTEDGRVFWYKSLTVALISINDKSEKVN